ncbi:hypothetical protein [Alteromonas sp. H39]|uniref:hypothetical protein n=1 Tax=Alteromonas sp. H39 TaxID=3389876 RepID=UPI0039E1140D
MGYRDSDKQLEQELVREKMRDVRSFKRRPERLSNKIMRFSDDEQLVEQASRKVRKINKAAAKIMDALEDLEENHAQALQLDSISQLFLERIDLPTATTDKLRRLAKLRRKLAKTAFLDDFRVLELFDQLKDDDLIHTTLDILLKKGQNPSLQNVITTIKRIHVEQLRGFRINKNVLNKFIKNKHVARTRPKNDFILGGLKIDIDFENKLNEEQDQF